MVTFCMTIFPLLGVQSQQLKVQVAMASVVVYTSTNKLYRLMTLDPEMAIYGFQNTGSLSTVTLAGEMAYQG